MAQIFKGPKCQRANGKGEEEYTAKEKGTACAAPFWKV